MAPEIKGGKTMKLAKRIGALLLAAVMMVPALSGCGEQKPTDSVPSDPTSNTVDEQNTEMSW